MTTENNPEARLRLFFSLAIALITVITLFIVLEPLLPYHALHGDERYYIGRALQDVEFYMGARPAKAVWFSSGNHPFSAETIIGLSILLQGKFRKAPGNPWKTPIDENLLVAARRSALAVGLLGLGALLFLALYIDPWLVPIPILYLLASPGFIDFSMRCMLDIYLASFTTLTLVCMVLYVLSKSRRWLLLSGFFEGLALGSKTGWDPLVAFLVCSIAMFVVEEKFRAFVKKWFLYVLASFTSFSVTSTVIVLRLREHINSVLAHHGPRIALENMFSKQPLIASSFESMAKLHYNIFVYQHPTCILLTALTVLVFTCYAFTILLKHRSIRRSIIKVKSDRLLCISMLVTIFMALTLLLTSMTFEYGRNYARLTFYECLAMIVCLAYIMRGRRVLVKTLAVAVMSLFLVLALYSYYSVVFAANYYYKGGYALVVPWLWGKGIAYLIPGMNLVNMIPWSSWLLLLSALSSLAVPLSMCLLNIPTLIVKIPQVLNRMVRVFRGTRLRLHSFLIRIVGERPRTPSHDELAEVREQVAIEEIAKEKPREALGSRESESSLEQALPPSLDAVARSLLEKLGETPTSEALIESVHKLVEMYEKLKGVKGLTLRETLLRIAEEHGLDANNVLEVVRAVEGYIYGGKTLAPQTRERILRMLKELAQS